MGISVGTADPFIVEVIYALPDRAVVKSYRLRPPATVADALALAAAEPDFAGIDVARSAVGIFGRTVTPGADFAAGRPAGAVPRLAGGPKGRTPPAGAAGAGAKIQIARCHPAAAAALALRPSDQ